MVATALGQNGESPELNLDRLIPEVTFLPEVMRVLPTWLLSIDTVTMENIWLNLLTVDSLGLKVAIPDGFPTSMIAEIIQETLKPDPTDTLAIQKDKTSTCILLAGEIQTALQIGEATDLDLDVFIIALAHLKHYQQIIENRDPQDKDLVLRIAATLVSGYTLKVNGTLKTNLEALKKSWREIENTLLVGLFGKTNCKPERIVALLGTYSWVLTELEKLGSTVNNPEEELGYRGDKEYILFHLQRIIAKLSAIGDHPHDYFPHNMLNSVCNLLSIGADPTMMYIPVIDWCRKLVRTDYAKAEQLCIQLDKELGESQAYKGDKDFFMNLLVFAWRQEHGRGLFPPSLRRDTPSLEC